MNKFERLRQRHPRFIYKSFEIRKKKALLLLKFNFLLEPDINFSPVLELPIYQDIDDKIIANFVFHLGLIETLSYWKTACSPELLVKAGSLTEEQINFWRNLIINGLGEFFYFNKIDLTKKGLINITSNTGTEFLLLPAVSSDEQLLGNLILCDGGKDSSVTLQILKKEEAQSHVLMLNPRQAAKRITSKAGFDQTIVVKRIIDKKLLYLNRKGYLNGHTPFSAFLAFLAVMVAFIYKKKFVIVSNERSSNEGNIGYRNRIINHQYSKSFVFEKKFHHYCEKYLTKNVNYFSLLRPIYELQISRVFSQIPAYHHAFLSCNVGAKYDQWCGSCAKCAFIYLTLSPFLSVTRMTSIFGRDFFQDKKIVQFIEKLVGLRERKPFECVGTIEESRLALILSAERYKKEGKELPEDVQSLAVKVMVGERREKVLKQKILHGWNEQHLLPKKFEKLVRKFK